MPARNATLVSAPQPLRHILADPDLDRPNHLCVLAFPRANDQTRFRAQLDLLTNRCHLVGAPELLDALAGHRPLAPSAAMLTFDRVHSGFLRNVWPTLREHRLPAVLFVPTAHPDDPKWARRCGRHRTNAAGGASGLRLVDHSRDTLGSDDAADGVASWDELRRLARQGVAVAAQTRTHRLLDQVAPARACDEVLGSINDVRQRTGTAWPLFAYPGGRFTPEVLEVLTAAGVRAAFTATPGVNDLSRAAPLQLRRFRIE